MSKEKRIEIAKSTIRILEEGYYSNRKGTIISIEEALEKCIENSILYRPDLIKSASDKVDSTRAINSNLTRFDVWDGTTLEAASTLWQAGIADIAVLNFASAKNPGGGFLNGSQAQEESIARSSGLYPCLQKHSDMYMINKAYGSCLYSDNMIYSPRVPVFRDDDGNLLDLPYLISIITSPAVNAGAIKRNEPDKLSQIDEVVINRLEKVLSVALLNGHRKIILGAWGCGVFENNPEDIARYFEVHLKSGRFSNQFERVVFAIKSKEARFIAPFKKFFGDPNPIPEGLA
jgi:uncharacterized protein (TIGR02452 family)